MTIATHAAGEKEQQVGSPLEVLLIFLKLGVTCFGGPIAHIGYFREEFVVRRDGSMSTPMPISWGCASSCRVRPAAKSDFPSASCGRAILAASRPGPALLYRPLSPSSSSRMAREPLGGPIGTGLLMA